MILFHYVLTLAALGVLFIGLIYVVTFVILGIFQAIIGYSAKRSPEERKQVLTRRSEPVLLLINSYLYATCVAALTVATVAAHPVKRPWVYYLISFLFLLTVSSLPQERKAGDSSSRMRYFLLTFLAASYIFPDFIAPFWKSLWGWWFS